LPRKKTDGTEVTMDYMVHEPNTTAKALIVLIAGGALNAGITGTDGGTPTAAGGNFLVRSAHLFAGQGYRVVTVDRPDDYTDYTISSNSDYDAYRISADHAVDLSTVINRENSAANVPVIIAGTSRGAVSAVAQHTLGAVIAVSSAVTSGGGSYLGTAGADPTTVNRPVHVLWHRDDGCSVSTPAGSAGLLSRFSDATSLRITGGYEGLPGDECGPLSYHGFAGVESCTVGHFGTQMDGILASVSSTRPRAGSLSDSHAAGGGDKAISLIGMATASAGGSLTYSLPHAATTLGGTVSIAPDGVVTYTPPATVSAATTDTFVYVVNESGGGTAHNVVSVNLTP
jgi:hypothetical protein